jgi:hypothetical protein
MAGKKESGTQWRHISVVIRADILEQAVRQKIDISGACNQALAELTGIDYRQQKIPEGIITEPLIVASNGIPDLPGNDPVKSAAPKVTAIINAEDPQAAKALKSRHLPKEKPAPDTPAPAPQPAPAGEKEVISHPAQFPTTEKAKKPLPRKKKEDIIKKFFSSMILREDSGSELIAKDDLYYAFERWCRNHRVLPVPDKKSFSVTLKNQHAVTEKMVDGTPTWLGVKVR